MNIPSYLAVCGAGIGTIAAELPRPAAVLSILTALVVMAPRLWACVIDRERMQRDDAFRRRILAHAPGLPDSERATVLCALTHTCSTGENAPACGDPSTAPHAP
ncbi:hypothetical protein ACFVU0_14065 [Streptomyces sp. NPDC058122]|uniref:hypothetical protein n=1 Tax=Streptomyces sp. NPDC058122 TaxID=3346349 RepID=UPI0036E99014